MMGERYTPGVPEIGAAYVALELQRLKRDGRCADGDRKMLEAEFGRGIAQVQAAAWDEGADAMGLYRDRVYDDPKMPDWPVNPYREAGR